MLIDGYWRLDKYLIQQKDYTECFSDHTLFFNIHKGICHIPDNWQCTLPSTNYELKGIVKVQFYEPDSGKIEIITDNPYFMGSYSIKYNVFRSGEREYVKMVLYKTDLLNREVEIHLQRGNAVGNTLDVI